MKCDVFFPPRSLTATCSCFHIFSELCGLLQYIVICIVSQCFMIQMYHDPCIVMCIASRSSCQYPAILITCRFRVSFEIWRITHTWLIQWVICVQHEGPTGSPEGSLSLRIRVPDGRQCYTTLCQCARSLTPLSSAGKLLKTSFYCLKLNQS